MCCKSMAGVDLHCTSLMGRVGNEVKTVQGEKQKTKRGWGGG